MNAKRSPRLLLTALAGLVASLYACSDTGAGPGVTAPEPGIEALVAAAPDGGGHPNVGLLAFDIDGEQGPLPPFALCGGSVVSDRVFLTAAHCIATAPKASWAVTLEPGSPEHPLVAPGVLPDDFPFPLLVPAVYADEVVVHPQFNVGYAEAHDVAVLLFPAGTFSDVTPVELPGEGELDALAAGGGLLGQQFTLVGYGASPIPGEVKVGSLLRSQYFVAGYRQVTEAPFRGLTPRWLELQMTGDATGEGGLCRGDSGSPMFLGASNVAMALAGGGGNGSGCGVGVSTNQRLDTPAEHDFLAQFIDLP